MGLEYIYFYLFTLAVGAIVYMCLRYVLYNLNRKMYSLVLLWMSPIVAATYFWINVKDSTQADEYVVMLLRLWMEI